MFVLILSIIIFAVSSVCMVAFISVLAHNTMTDRQFVTYYWWRVVVIVVAWLASGIYIWG